MGKLEGTVFYLSGPIDYADDSGSGWRNTITPMLKDMGIIVIDPLNKPTNDFKEDIDLREKFNKYKEEGLFQKLHDEGRDIRNFDLRCCDKADCIICYINLDIVMTGTYEEIFNANQSKKPVLIFCEQGKKMVPNWLWWTFPVDNIFENMGRLIIYLDAINREIIQPDKDRWKFFDWHKLLRKS